MATIGYNTNQDYADAREAFFTEGERKFYIKSLEDPKQMKIHDKVTMKSSEEKYAKAMELISMVENGLIADDEMPDIELKIAHLLSGEDMHVEKIAECLPDVSPYSL